MVNKTRGKKQLKRKSYSTNGARITSYPYAKNHIYYRQKVTRNEDLNVRAETIKFLEESRCILDLGLGNGFLDITPKAQVTNEKMGKGSE